ncbi:MAG: AI-2E family transporter [Nocardioides sp.]
MSNHPDRPELGHHKSGQPKPASSPAERAGFSRAVMPWGYDLAAAWAWRFLVLCAAGYVVVWLLHRFAVITVPLAVSLLVTALAYPAVRALNRAGVPQKLASGILVIGGLGTVVLLLTFVGQQVGRGVVDLADQVVKGIGEIENWLKTGPLNASDSQINDYLEQARNAISARAQNPEFVSQVTHFGTAVGHVVAGFFIVLFATYFLLADGSRIWAWFVRLTPSAARAKVDSSGRVAWVSLMQFVRATVFVAMADSLGIMIGAAILQVPFVLAIGVLVFLGAFVPMIGATVAGSVAVLVALVAQGPWTALFMVGVVILVQQIEGHVLQPFLMGSFVSVHPLGVIVAIGCGVLVAGIAGALIAVPLTAAVNSVAQHLASGVDDDVGRAAEQPPPDEPPGQADEPPEQTDESAGKTADGSADG